MHVAQVSATDDIPESALLELQSEMDGWHVEIDESRAFFRSSEPPSWIALVANADWWVKGLGALAALYIAEIVKEAGKETWKNRDKAFALMAKGTNQILSFAKALYKAKQKCRPSTYVSIGLPIPTEIYTTSLRSHAESSEELAVEISLFVHHIPALINLLEEHEIDKGESLGWVTLSLQPDGSLEVTWMTRKTLEQIRKVIPFEP